jgi:hypothetical protein
VAIYTFFIIFSSFYFESSNYTHFEYSKELLGTDNEGYFIHSYIVHVKLSHGLNQLLLRLGLVITMSLELRLPLPGSNLLIILMLLILE